MISMENVSAGYGKCEVLHKVSLEISGEGITTLIGANGCGKSTLLRVLLGFLPLWGGGVRIDGISLKEMPGAELAKRVAYLPQGKDVPDISAERMVLHGRFPYLSYPRRYRKADYEIAEAAMEQMGILPFAGKQMSRLSGGMRQKVYIAMALAQQAGIIVMDEPTTYLDIGQQLKFAQMMRQLAESGKTVLLVLHDILLALKISDRMAVLEEGQVRQWGAPEEIIRSGVIRRLYGVDVKSHRTEAGEQYYYDLPGEIAHVLENP